MQHLFALTGALVCVIAIGCGSAVEHESLPSAVISRDDLQYFPPGPEFKLSKQVQAIGEYKLRQQGTVDEQVPNDTTDALD